MRKFSTQVLSDVLTAAAQATTQFDGPIEAESFQDAVRILLEKGDAYFLGQFDFMVEVKDEEI